MENKVVIGIDKRPVLRINRELERELPALTFEQYADLKASIERDGILSPIVYWVNDGRCEIIDGHNRHRIAGELGLTYEIVELEFASIARVKYWMHKTNAARRGGSRNIARMKELAKEIQGEASPAEIVKQVAKDAGVSERTVWRSGAKGKDRAVKSPVEKIIAAIQALSDEDRATIKAWFIE